MRSCKTTLHSVMLLIIHVNCISLYNIAVRFLLMWSACVILQCECAKNRQVFKTKLKIEGGVLEKRKIIKLIVYFMNMYNYIAQLHKLHMYDYECSKLVMHTSTTFLQQVLC